MSGFTPLAIRKPKTFWQKLLSQWELVLMSVPLLFYKFIFSYLPLTGWTMAFQNYKLGVRGIFNQEWVGFKHFQFLFSSARFLRDVRNTLAMSFMNLISGYICAVVLALLINEVRHLPFKKAVQNISYLPHFLSWIIVAGMVSMALSTENGIINEVLIALSFIDKPILFLANKDYFWQIVMFSNLWKEVGWSTIIYLAAMTAIDPSLYEAAVIDGANRYHRMWHITLPGIKPTIAILLIMSTGYLLEAGFEIQYFLGNGLVVEMSETIDIFVLRYGMQQGNYSLSTVASILKTVVSVILVTVSNTVAGKLGEEKLI
ncbi:MAG: ABC transporter permease subunit [Treponema sp.]|jgi:putative aldouronate transport system permease protein|nr:ABC transporter permease subunit [Treponema sp.]